MENEQKPNILFILTDQHKLDAMGCYRDTSCQTPNLDWLAETGARFETAYTACPVCSPTRSTIMTGLYPHQHAMCCNVEDLGCSVHELVDRPALLTRRLQDVGYRCGYTGKWHLGSDREKFYGVENEPTLPRDVGFEGQQFPGHGGGGYRYPEYKECLARHGWEHGVIPQDDRPFHGRNCSSHDDLYDLGADPHEMHNLIDEPSYGGVVSQMRGLLDDWMEETAFPGRGYYRRTRMDKWPY